MEKSLFSEKNSPSAMQEIPCIIHRIVTVDDDIHNNSKNSNNNNN
jgi:hypothetical protein